MQINSMGALPPSQLQSAMKVVREFASVAEGMMAVDNDSVDLNSSQGEVKLDFQPLKKDGREKFTGELSFNPEDKDVKKMFVTKNYDKSSSVGVNYAAHDLGEGKMLLRKDDMYQEFPMYRQIDEVVIDKSTGEIKSFESYEERDSYMPPFGGGGGDYYFSGQH